MPSNPEISNNKQMLKNLSSVLLVPVLLAGCNSDHNEKLKNKANELAQTFIIIDGHVDLPYLLKDEGYLEKEKIKDITVLTDGDFDYPKAKIGGLDAPFMSIYIPAEYQVTGGAKELADSLIDMVYTIQDNFPDKFAVATSPEEISSQFEKGLISLPMGMENGAPLEDDLANVAYFHKRGISYITLTHGKDNLIGDSSYDTTYTWNGLSPFGEDVIKEMNRVGIMVDISHVSDSTFYDVMKITTAPAIASHSSCRYFTPGFERNMSDEMIKILAEHGGVIHINFGSTFLTKKSQDEFAEMREALRTNNPDASDSLYRVYAEEYLKNHNPFADVAHIADHIDHVVQIAGIDHVGLGSDFDGVGNTLPTGMKNASMLPNLIYELLKRGYTDEDIAKICYQNTFRVWNEVIRVAKNS